jgi:hypothetical protein
MHLGGADKRTKLLKEINDAIKLEQVYLRVKWTDTQYD